ncbi:ferrous iron transport protein B [Anaerotignum sp.]|uniref:ferrous iron transport protein B n=1 Tax=Anaerotignum sp. TaxID=2039241 RepID=UPI0027144BCF|nr:ferrous iron transport protein B [Anaerotignum sp.]
MKKLGLIGNPNSGKSALFNTLTGSDARVGNWPGVTVERKEGIWEKGAFLCIDLPGVYSLSPYTPEERATAGFILDEKPDILLQVIDTTALERSLFLTTQLLELDIPLVIGLNMVDVAKKQGIFVDATRLSEILEIPVVEISSITGEGSGNLAKSLHKTLEKGRRGETVISQDKIWARIQPLMQPFFQGTQGLFCGMRWLEQQEKFDWEGEIAAARYEFSVFCCQEVVLQRFKKETPTEKLDKLFLHPLLGIPIFFICMALIFHMTFSLSFLGTGIPSPGVFFRDGAEYGVKLLGDVTMSFFPQMPYWGRIFFMDGIFGGMGKAISYLPQILCLFFWLVFLEDSGYMARVAFLLDRPMRKLGISGRAFLPLLTGFGCSVPAMMSVRTLERESSRKITRLIIPFFSCGAKLPLYALLVGLLFPENGGLIMFCLYCSGIFIAVFWAIFLRKRCFSGQEASFIMEMPPYHLPRWNNIMRTLGRRGKEYLSKAATVILGASVIIWLVSHITLDFQMTNDSSLSILAWIGQGLTPFFIPLGFGSGACGWKASAAILTGLAAKEAVVSAITVLGGPEEMFTRASAISFMVFHLLSIPCVAAVSAFWCEEKKGKTLFFALCLWLSTAWIVSFLVYQIGRLIEIAF